MAKEHNVSPATVRRDAEFAADLDAIATNCGEQVRRDVLSGRSRLTKADIGEIARMNPEQQRQAITGAAQGKKKGPTKKKAGKQAANGQASAVQASEVRAQDEEQVMEGVGQAPAPADETASQESCPTSIFLACLSTAEGLAAKCAQDVVTLAGAFTDQEKADVHDYGHAGLHFPLTTSGIVSCPLSTSV